MAQFPITAHRSIISRDDVVHMACQGQNLASFVQLDQVFEMALQCPEAERAD